MSVEQLLEEAFNWHKEGSLRDASKVYRTILNASPGHLVAIRGLASVLAEMNQIPSLISLLQRSLIRHPRDPILITQLGLAFVEEGRTAEARTCFHLAIEKHPELTPAYVHAAALECEMRLFEAAKETAQLGLLVDYTCAALHLTLGRIERMQYNAGRALVHWQRALRYDPQCLDALQFLAALALEERHLGEAWDLARQMDPLPGGPALAHVIRGTVLLEGQEYAAAVQCFDKALAEDANQATAWHQIGVACFSMEQHPQAREAFRKATELAPDMAMAWYNWGRACESMGCWREAITLFRRAFELCPSKLNALAGWIQCKRNICDWTDLALLETLLKERLSQGDEKEAHKVPLLLHSLISDDMAQHLRLAMSEAQESSEVPVLGYEHPPSHPLHQVPRRLKVAYLSYDCRDHPMAHLMVNVLELHRRHNVEVYCYSVGPDDQSPYRRRMEAAVDHFIDAHGWSDAQLTEQIRRDRVHILVDLMGHTMGDRLTVLSRRPAPIQVSWLGYPGTTGADYMDYLLVDPIVAPPPTKDAYSEALAYLPTYQPNDSTLDAPVAFSRSEAGLPEDGLVLACFCRAEKIEPQMFGMWMRILARFPHALLWVYAPEELIRQNLRAACRRMGGDPTRLLFAGRLPKKAHIRRIAVADLILDTQMYNGHTTTSDALLAGVPVITLMGNHFPSRVSASLLTSQGLTDCVTYSLDEYEEKVNGLVSNSPALEELKQRTVHARQTGSLFDTHRFVKNIEDLYRQMVRLQVRGSAPRTLGISTRSR